MCQVGGSGSDLLIPPSDPFVGTWKLDLAQSKYDPGPRPKSQTRTWETAGDSRDQERLELFDNIECAMCHVRPLTTAPVGAKINGGTFTILDAQTGRTFHLFGDFVVLDVRTCDGSFRRYRNTTGATDIRYSGRAFQSRVS
jgi:hypothetical protein